MTIEQDFKEAKTRLEWKDCRIRKLDHYQRFTNIVMLAVAFGVLAGNVIYRRPSILRRKCRFMNGKLDKSMT